MGFAPAVLSVGPSRQSACSKEETTTEQTWSALDSWKWNLRKSSLTMEIRAVDTKAWGENQISTNHLFRVASLELFQPGAMDHSPRSPPAVHPLSSSRQKVLSSHLTAALAANQSTRSMAGRVTSKVCSELECQCRGILRYHTATPIPHQNQNPRVKNSLPEINVSI